MALGEVWVLRAALLHIATANLSEREPASDKQPLYPLPGAPFALHVTHSGLASGHISGACEM